jgi:hypothetical protein
MQTARPNGANADFAEVVVDLLEADALATEDVADVDPSVGRHAPARARTRARIRVRR